MNKINFVNNRAPALNANNLNQMQTNAENEINKAIKNNDASILADVTPIEILPETGLNYAGYGNSYYYKIGTRVHIHLGVSGLQTNISQTIFIPPAGYKPYGILAFCGNGGDLTPQYVAQGVAQPDSVYVVTPTGYVMMDMEYDAFS